MIRIHLKVSKWESPLVKVGDASGLLWDKEIELSDEERRALCREIGDFVTRRLANMRRQKGLDHG